MLKRWCKEFLAFCICIILILSPVMQVHAEDYVKDSEDKDGNITYYIIDGKDVNDLFDFGIADIDDLLGWIVNFRTFTVIKEVQNGGSTEYKMYFNTPNLQSIVKNAVTSNVNDGYTDTTYDVNDTEWLVKVGKNATTENVITKYGFNVPNYTYMGESPKATMTVAGIIPVKWYQKVWTGVKAIFGASFIDAPSADNYNTITYLNHGYTDRDDYVIEFLQNYYLPYFEHKIATVTTANGQSYFLSAEDMIARTVNKDDNDKAESYNSLYADDYTEICKQLNAYNMFLEQGFGAVQGSGMLLRGDDPLTFVCKNLNYQYNFEWWTRAQGHQNISYVMLRYITNNGGPAMEDFGLIDSPGVADKFSADNDKLATALLNINSHDIEYYDYLHATLTNGQEFESYKEAREYIAAMRASEDPDIAAYWQKIEVQWLYTDGCSLKMTPAELGKFFQQMYAYNYNFKESNFVSTEEKTIYTTFNKNIQVIKSYKDFVETMNHGADPDKNKYAEILYRQCMIPNDGEDGECYNTDYDNETSLTMANVYAYSGLYKITQNYPSNATKLSKADAYKIVNKLQSYCGPYYSTVLGNMIKLMCATAAYDGNTAPLFTMQTDDPRVMPYDVKTLTGKDAENYSSIDPRVSLYRSHTIGRMISDFELIIGFNIFIKPQQALVNIGGRITELSVFMQQIMSFDVLDSYGLSPTTMWNNAYVGLLMSLLALFFIVKTVVSVIKMGDRVNGHIALGFVFLFLELGFITSLYANPDKVWNMVKNVENNVMYLGEMSSIYSVPSLTYLYGGATDKEVTYYMPYLDLWSKYNTGYGILDKEQIMNPTTDVAELKDITYPKIGGNNIKHYSVMLMDAFSYYGDSDSVTHSVMENNHVYNGIKINNNAYRVVDHFLAPRVNIIKNGDRINLKIRDNENYNGEFQSGMLEVIVKLLNCVLICLLSLIKFMTFLWQWWVFYIFIFRVILAKGAEKKSWTDILIETFSPTLCLILIGLYSGMVMKIGMNASGVIGFALEIFLFWLTFMLLRWWKGLRYGQVFPHSLVWLYMLTNITQHRRNVYADRLATEAMQDARDAGITDFDSNASVDTQADKFFNDDGTIKTEFDKYGSQRKVFENWYKYAHNTKNRGHQLNDKSLRAMRIMETDDNFKQFTEDIRNGKDKSKSNKYQNKNKNKQYNQENNQNIKQNTKQNTKNNQNNQINKTDYKVEETSIQELNQSEIRTNSHSEDAAKEQQIPVAQSKDDRSKITETSQKENTEKGDME